VADPLLAALSRKVNRMIAVRDGWKRGLAAAELDVTAAVDEYMRHVEPAE
jgi:hypothetical protein